MNTAKNKVLLGYNMKMLFSEECTVGGGSWRVKN